MSTFKNMNLSGLLTLLLVAFGLTAYGQKEADKTYIKTTEKGTTYEVVGWEREVVYNPRTFTWFAWKDPIIEKKQTTETKMIPLSEFDRPPVFDSACLTEEDQFACSNNKLQAYIEQRFIDYPDPAESLEQEGLEYVTFVINQDGKFEGNLKVISKDKPCRGCADAAADIISDMEDMWFPAIKDGKTVKTQLTIPVRFKLIDF